MYIAFIYLIIFIFLTLAIIKSNKYKPEWILLLVILSFIKTCITYLFHGTTVFTMIKLGDTEIHLDDIILFITSIYVFIKILKKSKVGLYFNCILLMNCSILFSFMRGILGGYVSTSQFLADLRMFFLFQMMMNAFYLLMRKKKFVPSFTTFKRYIDILMNIVVIYVLIIWTLDLVFGVNNLPGQYSGSLNELGSSLRVVHPHQVLMLAIYTLYDIYEELKTKGKLTIRNIVFSLIIAMLQWRTVFIAFTIGLILICVDYFRKKRISKTLVAQVGLFVLCYMILRFYNKNVTGEMTVTIRSIWIAQKRVGTFATRMDVWKMIMEALAGINLIFGIPMGKKLGIAWLWSAHNGYIDYIVKTGLLGMMFVVIPLLIMISKAIKMKQTIIATIIFSIMIYWVGYGISIEQGALLGFFLAVLELADKKYLEVAYEK